MRILWVKAGKILPVNTGGRIRSFNILRHLGARNETVFLSYYPGAEDERYEAELKEIFPDAITFAAGAPHGRMAQALHYAARVAGNAPYAVAKFTSPLVKRAILDAVETLHPDVAVCDFLSASLNFPEPLTVPSVLFQHNVEYALWNRLASHEHNLLKRAVFKIEAAKMRHYEAKAVRRFHRVVAVSENDRSLMEPMTGASRISVVPTGVDVGAYTVPAEIGEPDNVMFLGSMDWPANIDGVEYFCEQIWPHILAAIPAARFHVVGRNPPRRIERLQSASIDIVGGVPSVLPQLRASSVFVVPLRVGGGTRLKIYEAMAAERAIVSTSVGAEGLEYRSGIDVLIADDPISFARCVVELLQDPKRRQRMGRAAGQTAARFDWSQVSQSFETVLRQTIADRAPSGMPVACAN